MESLPKIKNLHVPQRHHADGLPDAQGDARCHTPIQSLEAILLVDVFQRLAHGQVLGSVGVLGLALHFDSDDLDRLVPGRQPTADSAGGDLFERGQLLSVFFAGEVTDDGLGESGQTEARPPVGGLADGHGVDSLVDAPDAFFAVDIHEGGEGAGGLDALGGQSMLRDLHCFHACAEAHGGVSLGNTTRHASQDAPDEVAGTCGFSVVFSFGGYKEEHRALSRGFDPGPRNETLVNCDILSENHPVCSSIWKRGGFWSYSPARDHGPISF